MFSFRTIHRELLSRSRYAKAQQALSAAAADKRSYLTQLKGRSDYLPGGQNANLPETIKPPQWDRYPFLMDVKGIEHRDLLEYSNELKQGLRDRIRQNHAVLMRGLPIGHADQFSKVFFEGFGFTPMGYKGGAGVRDPVNERIYTASREPKEFNIELHNEMASMDNWPLMLAFYCDTPPKPGCGGETAIAEVKDIMRDMDDSVLAKFARLGCRYHRHLTNKSGSDYQSWQEVFHTVERVEVEKYLKERNWSFEWCADGHLSLYKTLPVFRNHQETGELLWFNHVQSHHASYLRSHPSFKDCDLPDTKLPFTTYYGDGSEIETDVLDHVREVTWNNTVGFQLQKGDMLIMDNMHVQHARLSFTGERKILVALSSTYMC